ncbi:MAG: 1-acyl-sn-glycerol-3-phosphate acyltransferase [Oscillospiraceae bacterium]|nr:1-acyl-sn-glycerol-3-phosphate acyltransferase [Oscillospiraceae bacterium]
MLLIYILLFVLFCAGAFAMHAAPAVWHAGLWIFGGFALLNVLYVLFWVAVASTVDDEKPLEKPNRLCCFGCRNIPRWLCFWFRVRVHLTGEELLPEEGRFVMVSNHRSGFDPLTVEAALGKRGLAFISKPSNLKIPFVGKLGYGACFLPIDRENDRKALRTILTAVDYIKKDFCSIVIYPEGTRSRTGELLPFHAGSFKIAQKANVPLVIACTSGSEQVMHNCLLRTTPVELRILEVLPAEKVKATHTQELAAYSRGLMEAALNGERSEASA